MQNTNKSIKQLIRNWLIVSVLGATSVGCFAEDIVIGQVASMTGSNGADLGQGLQVGLRVAIAQANEVGGIAGRKLRLAVRDDKYIPEETVRLTQELLDQESPIALAGYRGTANTLALVKSDLLKQAGIPLVGTLTGAGELQGAVNIFHVRTSYRDEISQIVGQLSRMSASKIGLFYVDDAFGQAGRDALEKALAAQGTKAAAIAAYNKAPEKVKETIDAAVETLVTAAPQAIVMVAVGEPVYEFVKRIRARLPSTRLVSLSVVDSGVMVAKVGIQTARGIGFSQVFPYPYNDTVKLVREYRIQLLKHGGGVTPNYFNLEGYISGRVLIDALRRSGPNPTRQRLIEALNKQGEINLEGFFLKFDPQTHNGSHFTELTVISRDGRLMR